MKCIYKPFVLFVFLFVLVSCTNSSLTLSDTEGISKIETILSENFESDAEVYKLEFSANTLEEDLNTIHKIYKYKDLYFGQRYYASGGFDDPKKTTNHLYKTKKPFKISEVSLKNIPEKFQAAITYLKENDLHKDGNNYVLNSIDFKKDNKGNLYSEIELQYRMGSSKTSSRRIEIRYGEYTFKINANNELKFIK